MPAIDPIALAQALIRCRSVTPEDGGALAVLEAALKPLGFICRRLRFAVHSSHREAAHAVASENLMRLGERIRAAQIRERACNRKHIGDLALVLRL